MQPLCPAAEGFWVYVPLQCKILQKEALNMEVHDVHEGVWAGNPFFIKQGTTIVHP